MSRKDGESTSRASYPVDLGEEANSKNLISPLIACSPKSTATDMKKSDTLPQRNEQRKACYPMGTVHDLLEARGKQGALEAGLDRSVVEAAALYMGDEDGALNFANVAGSGFSLSRTAVISAMGAPVLTGGRPGPSPVKLIMPLMACAIRSKPGRSA